MTRKMKLSLSAAVLAMPAAAVNIRGSGRTMALHTDGDDIGNDKCPCIGFDDVGGEVVGLVDGKKVKYPAELGAHCAAWDEKNTAACKGDKAPAWCSAKWCYVDPKNCHLDVVPKPASYLPNATFQNLPLYYSYATCGSVDTWAAALPKIGSPGCRCIGIDDASGTLQVKVPGGTLDMPAELGGECQAWDQGKHPDCQGETPPEWCGREYCFVDPCSCSLDVPPKTSDYLDGVTFQGKQVYYSYATCGAKDAYSSEEKVAASKKKTQEMCSSHELTEEFGDEKCPCVGFEGAEGEALVVAGGKEVKYPVSLGSSCKAWDHSHTPGCAGDSPPEWCSANWCYVNPKHCSLDVVPKKASYMPKATFQNMPIYYSYATCGAKDTWTKELPKIGSPGCRCIGFEDVEGTLEVKVGDKKLDFPAELGGECKAWDKGMHPVCKGEKPPAWCGREYCFVDPCSCSLDVPPKISDYLAGSTFQGRQVYYSYATCGEKDAYSSKDKLAASTAKIAKMCGAPKTEALAEPPSDEKIVACTSHIKALIAQLDRHYTDAFLESTLSGYCELSREHPHAYSDGFDSYKSCAEFAKKLTQARDRELKGEKPGYAEFCRDALAA